MSLVIIAVKTNHDARLHHDRHDVRGRVLHDDVGVGRNNSCYLLTDLLVHLSA